MRTCTQAHCDKEATPPLILCQDHEHLYNSSSALRRPTPPMDEWRTKLAEDITALFPEEAEDV
jgi:hypothetical protein